MGLFQTTRNPFFSVALAAVLGAVVLGPGAQTAWAATAFDDPSGSAAARDGLVFEVTVTPSLLSAPTKGRLFIFLIPGESNAEPRLGPSWFQPQPFYAVDVESWKPGQTLRLDSRAVGFPVALNETKPGKYTIQAVFRVNPDTHRIGNGEGNAYGPVVQTDLDPKKGTRVPLTVDRLVSPRKFESSDRIKLVELDSPMLSDFHHRPDQAPRGRNPPRRAARRETPSCRLSTSFPASAATTSWRCALRTAPASASAATSSA